MARERKRFSPFWAVTGQERALFLRSLSVMFQSGVPLARGLDMLARQQVPGSPLGLASQSLSQKVQGGRYLSNAMSAHPDIFSASQVRLVAVGEKTGQLAQVLQELASLDERQTEIHLKVRSSLTMPLLVCGLCLLMVALAPPLLFRGLFEMLRESGGQLPWATRILVTFSDALRSPVFYVGLAIGLLSVFLAAYRSGGWRNPRLARWLRGTPVIGPTLALISLTRFSQNLKTTTQVGLPILQCLTLSAQACDDPVLEEEIVKVVAAVEEGSTIGAALTVAPTFPSAFCQSVAAGEESGALTSMLESLARLYRVELDHSLEMMTKALEPLMLGFVGAVVGFTVVATLLPMLKVIESL